jgi:dipeptidyl aminopeptidase/acylaminoacyl peptidase
LIKSLKKKVGIIIGELDENTFPKLSIDYFELLKKNNVQSELLLINVAHSFWHIYTNKEAIELGKSLVNK